MGAQVQEAAAASEGLLRIPDVAVNLGNVHLAQQEYVAAIQMYQSTLKKYYGGRDATVLLYLARAYYDSDRLREACSALLKAVHLQPTNHNLRFNVGLTLQVPPHMAQPDLSRAAWLVPATAVTSPSFPPCAASVDVHCRMDCKNGWWLYFCMAS